MDIKDKEVKEIKEESAKVKIDKELKKQIDAQIKFEKHLKTVNRKERRRLMKQYKLPIIPKFTKEEADKISNKIRNVKPTDIIPKTDKKNK